MTDKQSKPSRRDLLGASLQKTAPVEQKSTSHVPGFGPLFQFSANAMGCEFQIMCSKSGREAVSSVIVDAFQLISDLEDQLSIFRPASEMSAINQLALETPVAVEQQLFDLLMTADEINRKTEGAFDISATPLSRLWKQHRSQRTLPSDEAICSARQHVGRQKLRLDPELRTIRFCEPGVTLDLGGIGKGYALDRVQDLLARSGCENFLIHGGQSSVIAHGKRSSADESTEHPWQIGISHPLTPGIRLANLTLHGRAVGTSGSGRLSFVANGKQYGHIIDPRNGWPADQLLSVTVIASTAVQADALATGIFVLGPARAQDVCDQLDLSAILIQKGEGHHGLSIQTINLPESDFQQLS